MRGPDVLKLPPALLTALQAEHERAEYRRRYFALLDRGYLGESSFGTESKWVGTGAKPKSDWEYSNQEQQAYLTNLRRLAGIADPPEVDAAQADQAAWALLRQQRRIRA